MKRTTHDIEGAMKRCCIKNGQRRYPVMECDPVAVLHGLSDGVDGLNRQSLNTKQKRNPQSIPCLRLWGVSATDSKITCEEKKDGFVSENEILAIFSQGGFWDKSISKVLSTGKTR